MSRYVVMVDDNFHYMDEEERWEYGTFDSVEEALTACRHLVDRSLLEHYEPGMTTAKLVEAYTFFGDDPFILVPGGDERVAFSARDYARDRAKALCKDSELQDQGGEP